MSRSDASPDEQVVAGEELAAQKELADVIEFAAEARSVDETPEDARAADGARPR